MTTKLVKPQIKYTARDYFTIREELINHAKRVYASTYKDFGEASFGSLMLDTVAYVGDVMSFYLDYQANESFLSTALQYENIASMAKGLGFKFPGAPAAHGIAAVFCQVPASPLGSRPDEKYMPIMEKGSTFVSEGGVTFQLIEDINFADSQHEIVIAQVNETTGAPENYAINAYGRVVSGEMQLENFQLGDYTPFLKLDLLGGGISEILTVYDEEGHIYHEVDYLSQDVVYQEYANHNSKTADTRSVMKPIPVPRRFVVEYNSTSGASLQFGFGIEESGAADAPSSLLISDPANVVLKRHAKSYTADKSFDPSNLLETDKFGITPCNTTLTVLYVSNRYGSNSAAVGTVNTVKDANLKFGDVSSLDGTIMGQIYDSLQVDNEEPINGVGRSIDSGRELKLMAYDSFASQNRAVTKQDYLGLIYRMPGKFGSILRANLVQDTDSFKRNLNLYVIGSDQEGYMAEVNSIAKNNLKTYLNQYKMINDTIDILNARVVNFGVEYTAVARRGYNKYDVLSAIWTTISSFLERTHDIGEGINISDIYKLINLTPGVVDTTEVIVTQKLSSKHSQVPFDIELSTSADGRFISAAENVVFELKYPSEDIKGNII
jgi:hypothetical protein